MCFVSVTEHHGSGSNQVLRETLGDTTHRALAIRGMSLGNAASQTKAKTLTNLVRMRGLLPDLLLYWLLLDRGRVRHIAAEFLAELRNTTRINLCVIASARDSDIGHAAVEEILSAQLRVHVNQDTVGSLALDNEEVKVVQELLRHANSRITLDLYAQAGMPNKRLAQSKLVRMTLNKGEALA